MIWEYKEIREVGKVITGKTPPMAQELYYKGGSEFFISPKDLSRDGVYVSTTRMRVTPKALEKFKNQVIPKDSILFTSLSYGFGKMGIATKNSLTNQQINTVVVDLEKSHPKFLFYLLKVYTPFIFSYNSGIDTPIVPKSVFEKIKLPFPPLPVQKKIAAILTTYDEFIETNNRRIQLLENMAEEIYREWFVRLRFPGHEKVKVVKGVPEGWKQQTVKNSFEYLGGGTPSKSNAQFWSNASVNWFTPTDITAKKGIFLAESSLKCNEKGIKGSAARLFPACSLMMTSRATIGEVGINKEEASTNQGFITCIPNNDFPLPFLYFWLKLSKSYFLTLCGGATFPELSKNHFGKINIIKPSSDIMAKYTEQSIPIFDQLDRLIQANINLTETRDKLLPRLISGKLSVENLNINFPPSMEETAA